MEQLDSSTGDDLNHNIEHKSKNRKLFLILSIVAIISAILSFGVQEIINLKSKEDINILLVSPTKTDPGIAKSMRDGSNIYTQIKNNSKNSEYNYFIDIIDEDSDSFISDLQNSLSQKDYSAIVGFSNIEIFNKHKDYLLGLDIPITTTLDISGNYKNIYTFTQDQKKKIQFVANYVRNVKKEYMTYFAHDNSDRCQMEQKEFDSVYKKFEIPLSGTVSTNEDITKYFENVDYGSVYICGNDNTIPKILKDIKKSKTELNIYTNEMLALDGAKEYFVNKANTLHGISLPSLILFDTTNESAQKFLNKYKEIYNKEPDWLSALYYDLVKVSFEKKLNPSQELFQGSIQEYDLTSHKNSLPIKMGLFNGEQLISAPIQLQDIKNKNSINNYIEALRDNRVLYVNNEFMYKTNVVYTGININSVTNIKEELGTADVDFSIWFRYEGQFDANAIVFLNSDIKLGKPDKEITKENSHYVRFRTKGTFKLNFFGNNRGYGLNTVNIVYRHKNLNQNNLLFVADILGMPSNAEILKYIKDRQIIDPSYGWQINDFWISQILMKDFSEGEPKYVGFSGEEALFSAINVQMQIESSMLSAKDFIPKSAFIFLLIFGFVGMIAARLMDRNQLGRYWYVQSYILRLIFIPMFVISSGNMILDWAYLVNFNTFITGSLVLVYETTWWILPAYLLDLAIKRFIWEQIGQKVSKKIPHIIIVLTTFVIYTLAICGAIAFVFNKELTSILAASGVLAMVIGLAIQANIANVFSGLILNMDRPFKVGEDVLIDNIAGVIYDISWRTIKIKTVDGTIVSIPNDKVSNIQTVNLSRCDDFHKIVDIELSPDIDPQIAIDLIKESMMSTDYIIKKEDSQYGCRVYFKGYDFEVNSSSKFVLYFTTTNYYDTSRAMNDIWQNLYKIAEERNVKLI
jgi:small-conductance mechanosensitive channel